MDAFCGGDLEEGEHGFEDIVETLTWQDLFGFRVGNSVNPKP